MHWTPKGYKPWRQRPEVPSEKPKHKNNSMSKNKIPSSEVPGARPLPAAGTSPFPCSWRSQAALTQSWSARARNPPDPGRAPGGACWQPSAPPCGLGRNCGPREEAAARPASPATQRLAVPAGPPPPPSPAGLSALPLGLPLPPGPPRRAPPSPPSARAEVRRPPGSPTAARRKRAATAAPPPAPRRAARRVPDRSRVTWPRAGGGSGLGGREAEPGGADPGRGAAPLLDGRGSPERRRRRRCTVSDRPTLGGPAGPGLDPGFWPPLWPRAGQFDFLGLLFSPVAPHVAAHRSLAFLLRVRVPPSLALSLLTLSCFLLSLSSLTLRTPFPSPQTAVPAPLRLPPWPPSLAWPSPAFGPQGAPAGFVRVSRKGPELLDAGIFSTLPPPSGGEETEAGTSLAQGHGQMRQGRPHLNLTPEFPD